MSDEFQRVEHAERLKSLLSDERFKTLTMLFENRIREIQAVILNPKTPDDEANKLRRALPELQNLNPVSIIQEALRVADNILKRKGTQ